MCIKTKGLTIFADDSGLDPSRLQRFRKWVYDRVALGYADNRGVKGVVEKLFAAGLGDEAKKDWCPRICVVEQDGPPVTVVYAREVRAHYLAGGT